MKKVHILLFLLVIFSVRVRSQDTFSIVAVDPVTREVGSAGGSCVDLFEFPYFGADQLADLFPGIGAINTQAGYSVTNQKNSRERMKLGESPSQIINWLLKNDVSKEPEYRQYGIVILGSTRPEIACYSGDSIDDYKSHIIGLNYAIQGNRLYGQEVLDSMEAYFIGSEGDLAHKLMAALQRAKIAGGDKLCSSNRTSCLFAFIKVAEVDDPFGQPSLLLSVKTKDKENIEPIDSLQTLFNRKCKY